MWIIFPDDLGIILSNFHPLSKMDKQNSFCDYDEGHIEFMQ